MNGQFYLKVLCDRRMKEERQFNIELLRLDVDLGVIFLHFIVLLMAHGRGKNKCLCKHGE